MAGEISRTNQLLAGLVYEQARSSPRFQDPQRLLQYGFSAYSQFDEDGIIEEIFARIGTSNRFFVEFGVEDGLENCTLYRLLQGWRGAWIEGSRSYYQRIRKNFSPFLHTGALKVMCSYVTPQNVESLFAALEVPLDLDLLSIDIDNHDYWVWRAIESYRPRVVVIEYNASFREKVACCVPYVPGAGWNLSNYFGASLKALEELGRAKGYCLVGCNYSGIGAFFVREDLAGDRFAPPFTSENHYEPPRYLTRIPNGHPPGFGPLTAGEPPDRRLL